MRIGIANDMPLALEALRRAIALNPEHSVIWSARDGFEAVERCALETPDLILMDLLMPRMDGVEATRRIMAATPCAILIVTVNVGTNSERVFEAMGHGALDAVDTPQLGVPGASNAAPLLHKIDNIGKLTRTTTSAPSQSSHGRRATPDASTPSVVVIGASSGGPAALARLLSALPHDFSAAIVVVQHVDQQFAAGMATWLAQQSPLPVRTACEGDAPIPGSVLLAATNDHLIFKTPHRLGYTPNPIDYPYRPSIDVFFGSASDLWDGKTIGVLLTGMGRDGAAGLKMLRERGSLTIAQDEASSAVFGMPKAAARLGAAVEILALERIAPRLVQFCSQSRVERV